MPISPRLKKTCETPKPSSTSRSRCSSRNGRREVEERQRGTARTAGSRRTARSACARTRPRSRAPSSRRPGRRSTARAIAPAAVVHLHLDDLAGRRGSSSPASGPRPFVYAVGSSGRVLALASRDLLGRARRSARPRARCARRTRGGSRLRRRAGRGPRACAAGAAPRRRPARAPLRSERALSRATARCAKLHILFPTKFSGVAATIEIAWAGTSGSRRRSRAARGSPAANRNAATLTAKKRAAWKPAWPPRARRSSGGSTRSCSSRRPRRRAVAATRWWTPSSSTQQRRTRTGSPRSRTPPTAQNLTSCTQLCGLRSPCAHAAGARRAGGRATARLALVGHAVTGTPKWSSTIGVTSASDHCSRVAAASDAAAAAATPSESSAVQRAVAAAADVVGAAPVDELVAGRGREQHVAGGRARRAPTTARPSASG